MANLPGSAPGDVPLHDFSFRIVEKLGANLRMNCDNGFIGCPSAFLEMDIIKKPIKKTLNGPDFLWQL